MKKNSHLKEMTSAETRPVSITTTTTMTDAAVLQDSMIKRKIDNATEGLNHPEVAAYLSS